MLDSKAYTEAYYMINFLDEESKGAIPNNIMKNIENRMDKNYKFNVDENNVKEVKLLRDTEKILSVIYTDYLATEEERKIILEAEKKLSDINKNKFPKTEVNEMFMKKQRNVEDNKMSYTNIVEVPKENIFTRILDYLKKLLKIKK